MKWLLLWLTIVMPVVIFHNYIEKELQNKFYNETIITTPVGKLTEMGDYESLPTSPYTLKKNENSTVDMYLGSVIFSPNYYFNLARDLKKLGEFKVLYLHLAGEGGDLEGCSYIINILKSLGVKIIPIVDGDIASCHAFLSLSFSPPLINNSIGYIYFHNSSTTNEENNRCEKVTGTDRGYPAKLKCLENVKAITEIYNNYIYKVCFPFLTNDEISRIKAGRDVIISLQEFKTRIVKE